MKQRMNVKNMTERVLASVVMLVVVSVAHAQGNQTVFTNGFKDNWELSFGTEYLSFYSNNEAGLGLSKSPFKSYRANFGASASLTKWFTPEIGLRTKASGYWGKSILSDDAEKNAIRFYAFQEQVLFNAHNLLYGYDENRKWNLSPYVSVGYVRDCTHSSSSLGTGFGLLNQITLSDHLKFHADLGMTLAGDNNPDENSNVSGRFKWFNLEVGLTFRLGKGSWKKTKRPSSYNFDIKDYGDLRHANQEDKNIARVVATAAVPTGMVLIPRGHLRMGIEELDSLWGVTTPIRDISVDDFWMDKTEITNRQWQAFVKDIVDSIVSVRMADPYYLGDRERVMESLYITNPVTGKKSLDARQINYCYEVYDEVEASLRRNRLDPRERNLNTDVKVDLDEEVIISKDTAYIDNSGNIVRETINRTLSGPYDFLNTYIVNICPDTTCWVNDFPNSDNTMYMRYYYSHPDYQDYPVVGITWEQANAYCAWRTEQLKNALGGDLGEEQPYRLPTEAEWEYAARGKSQNEFPWEQNNAGEGKQLFLANFQPADGNYTKDGNIITSRVGIYPSNTNGLYDMAGNVAEWTSTAYTTAGVEAMNNINPQLKYNAAVEDPYRLKKKSVRGGSWKDSESHIRAAWRTAEYQNMPRSYIGFRCVRSVATKPSERAIIVKNVKK